MQRKRLLMFTLIILIGIVYSVWNPAECHYFPKCIFLQLTGLQCPGCGSQRALHQLLEGNIKSAFDYNPFLIIISPWLIVLLCARFIGLKIGYKVIKVLLHRSIITIYLITIILWWIYRNIV